MVDKHYDVIIIGGGATGLGTALEAASRGYKTLLLEAYDYGKGTSSKSTKLVHGGIRYLANFDFELVKEGLEERFYFLQNAPHLAKIQSYLIPFNGLIDKIKYILGIKLYDFLAKDKKIGQSKFLSKKQVFQMAPQLNLTNLTGGAIYFDGNFDDSRMLVTLLKTFETYQGVALNYHEVIDFIYQNNQIVGVKVNDKLNNQQLEFNSKVVINATGTLTDTILNKAQDQQKYNTVSAAQGTHLVFEKNIFNSPHTLVIPKTIDGRILFVSPWHDKIIVGTTDIKVDNPIIEPIAQKEEIDFILSTLNQYLCSPVSKKDIKSVFCGQRPLVKEQKNKSTAKLSRKHEIFETSNGLITIVGGKWTIYRKMGEDTINYIINKGILFETKSISRNLKLFGYTTQADSSFLGVYGNQNEEIRKIQIENNNFAKLHPNLPYLQAEIIYQIRNEQAKTLEDVLARRTHAVILDANAAKEAAPLVAKIMADELKQDGDWIKHQISEFNHFVKAYIIV